MDRGAGRDSGDWGTGDGPERPAGLLCPGDPARAVPGQSAIPARTDRSVGVPAPRSAGQVRAIPTGLSGWRPGPARTTGSAGNPARSAGNPTRSAGNPAAGGTADSGHAGQLPVLSTAGFAAVSASDGHGRRAESDPGIQSRSLRDQWRPVVSAQHRLQRGPAPVPYNEYCPACANGCGSLKSDLGFILGSCRSFFNPCGPIPCNGLAAHPFGHGCNGCNKCPAYPYGQPYGHGYNTCVYDTYMNH